MISGRKRTAFFAIIFAICVLLAGWALSDVQLSGGQMIFVPSASQPQTKRYTLAVRGLERGEVDHAPVAVEYLPGALFGIYAPDAQGEMQPWPDPRAPQSPFVIRTEAQPVSFDLPDGTEFYVRQESAPEGYLPMPAGYWSIAGHNDLRVDNTMPGGLQVRAQGEDGSPLAEVKLRLMQEGALLQEGQTGADGAWRVDSLPAGEYTIEEAATPQDYLPVPDAQRTVTVRDAAWAGIAFVHQRKGRLLVQTERAAIRPNGQVERAPLTGVGLAVLDENRRAVIDAASGQAIEWNTDANGLAQSVLSAGSYVLRVTRQPQDAPVQLVEETTFSIADGQDTELTLTAAAQEGYVRFALSGGLDEESGIPLPGVRCVLEREGVLLGTYTTDAGGQVVTVALVPGEYQVRYEGLPGGYVLPAALQGGQTLSVEPSSLLENAVVCPPVLTARWTLCIGEVGEHGEIEELPLGEAAFTVLDGNGNALLSAEGEAIHARSGADSMLELTLPAGRYLLQPNAGQPSLERALGQPVAFELPQERQTVTLVGRKTRLVLRAAQQDGARLGGSSYRVVGESGDALEVTADAQGQAVTPALEPGKYYIETVLSADGFGPAEAIRVDCEAGVPLVVDMLHRPLGTLEAKFIAQALNSQGQPETMPLTGMRVALMALQEGGDGEDLAAYAYYPSQEAPLLLTVDAQGIARMEGGSLPALPAGMYRAVAQTGAEHADAGPSAPVEVSDGAQAALEWTTHSTMGGVRIALRDAENTERALTEAAFELSPEEAAAGAAPDPLVLDAQGSALRVQLPQGQYRLRQTRWPEGFDPIPDQSIEIAGGALTEVSLLNVRRGTLTVDKQGYTFNSEMQQFRVPLRGAYAVYTLADGVYLPYPSQDAQAVLTAHGLAIEGAVEQIDLPAALEGAPYFLREVESAVSPGYLVDSEYHEVRVYPGQHAVAEIAALADKGFFVLAHRAAEDDSPLIGGTFELYAKTGEKEGAPVWAREPALSFELQEAFYQNEMALPVGDYRLVMCRAPQGYMLDADIAPIEQVVSIPAYVHRGNPMAQVELCSMRAPQQGEALGDDSSLPLYSAVQGLQLASSNSQADIVSVTVGEAHDALGTPLSARVVYYQQGGWNWADSREVDGLEQGPRTVDLNDVPSRILAVQVRYMDGRDGSPQLNAGFHAEDIQLTVASEQNVSLLQAWQYEVRYRNEAGELRATLIYSQPEETVPQAIEARKLRPIGEVRSMGGVSGKVWRMRGLSGEEGGDPGEGTNGVRVLLERIGAQGEATPMGEAVLDERGMYNFEDIPFDTYRLRFVAPEGDLIAQTRDSEGESGKTADTSPTFELNEGNSWHWAQAGIVRGAEVRSSLWLDANLDAARDEGENGAAGIAFTLWQAGAEVASVQTGEDGSFALTGLLPGSYMLRTELPENLLFTETTQALERPFELALGERMELPGQPVVQASRIAGLLLADGGSQGIASARVELMLEGSEQPLRSTTTDAQGWFGFERLTPGTYSLRVALPSAYVFPRDSATQEGQLAVRDVENGLTAPFALAMGETLDALRIQALRPAKLTIVAWEDREYLGTRSESNAGVSGVKVALAPTGMPEEDASQLEWQTTGPDGVAQFERVEPGDYDLWYQIEGNWRLTRGVDAQGKAQPMQRGATGHGPHIRLNAGQEETFDVGLVLPAALRGAAWLDADDNGLWDAGEAPFVGAEVMLDDLSGMLEPMRVLTDERGEYRFDEMPPGSYRLTFVPPQGHVFADYASPSKEIQLAMAQVLEKQNMGLVQTAEVSGMIWEDSNNNGERNEEETAVPGAEVALYSVDSRSQRSLLFERQVDEEGAFVFTGLRPGTYQLDCALPESYVVMHATASPVRFGTAKRNEPLHSASFMLAMGSKIEGVTLAALRLGSLAGSVWIDADYDGLRGAEEKPLPKVAVALWKTGGTEPAFATLTARDGSYQFDALPPGEYELRFTLPEGYLFTRTSAQSLPESTGREASMPLALEMGEKREGMDAGALIPAELSGLSWIDQNNDGMLDANEPALVGTKVELLNPEDPANPVAEVVSDEQGRWSLTDVMPSAYQLRITLPEGTLFATAPQRKSASRGGDIFGVDAAQTLSERFDLQAGERKEQFHIGGIPAGSIEGTVWLDGDDDGLYGEGEQPVGGVTVTLLDGTNPVATAETGEQGEYRFDTLRPGAYKLRFDLPEGYLFARVPKGEGVQAGLVAGVDESSGESAVFSLVMGAALTAQNAGVLEGAVVEGQVWLDPDESGTLDDDEQGLAGALAECLAVGSDQVLRSVRTGVDGAYRFVNLRPGTYQVRVTAPEGHLFAPQADAVLTLADNRQGVSEAFDLLMGEENEMDAVAALAGASIGGTAWEDANVDGRYDSAEVALPGTLATLLRQEGSEWVTLSSVAVNDQGAYRFGELRPGTYAVRFTLPEGFLFTDQLSDTQVQRSSVAATTGTTGESHPVQLSMGDAVTDLHVGGIRPGMLGDTVWIDENGNGWQDYGEPPLSGVKVVLLALQADGSETEAASALSDEYGFYRLDNLRPGLYRIRVELPEGYGFTVNAPDLPEIDSDIPEGAGPVGTSKDFVIRSGQAKRDIDIGAHRAGAAAPTAAAADPSAGQ